MAHSGQTVTKQETNFSIVARWVGLMGGLIGLVGGAFGIAGYFSHSDEVKIATALDVSRSYLRETGRDMIKMFNEVDGNQNLDAGMQQRMAEFSDYAEYVSLLANKNLLNDAYLSPALICAIEITATTVRRYKLTIPNGGKEMQKFAGSHSCPGP
jgi:hypothetical protein